MSAAVLSFPSGTVVQLPRVRAMADELIRYVAVCQAERTRVCPAGAAHHLARAGFDEDDLVAFLRPARDIVERETGVAL